jgi:hypothetical protein
VPPDEHLRHRFFTERPIPVWVYVSTGGHVDNLSGWHALTVERALPLMRGTGWTLKRTGTGTYRRLIRRSRLSPIRLGLALYRERRCRRRGDWELIDRSWGRRVPIRARRSGTLLLVRR